MLSRLRDILLFTCDHVKNDMTEPKEVEILFNYHVDEDRDNEIGVPLSKFNLNFRKQPKDPRDIKFKTILHEPIDESTLPLKVDLTKDYKILDQGSLGSCVANSVAGCIRYARIRDSRTIFDPSRLYIYYYSRQIEGTIDEDAGCYIRTAYKCVDQFRTCGENNWPYVVDRFREEPPDHCKQAALTHKRFAYVRVNHKEAYLRKCLAEGYPVSVGFDLTESFMSLDTARTGYVKTPDWTKEESVGGHCMTLVGYDHDKKHFIVANSWSESWGDKGFCYIPYDYVLDKEHVSDLWTVRSYLPK